MSSVNDVPERASDVALMMRVRDGEEEAFAALYHRHHRNVLDFFYGMGRNAHLAEDLCQETFMRIWKLRRRYRAAGSFRSYLFAFARYIWLEQVRKMRRRPAFALMDTGVELEVRLMGARFWIPDEAANHAELERRIWDALDCLPDTQRMVFILRVIHNLPLDEIASIMQCPLNTVRSRKLLAIKKMRQTLGKLLVS